MSFNGTRVTLRLHMKHHQLLGLKEETSEMPKAEVPLMAPKASRFP